MEPDEAKLFRSMVRSLLSIKHLAPTAPVTRRIKLDGVELPVYPKKPLGTKLDGTLDKRMWQYRSQFIKPKSLADARLENLAKAREAMRVKREAKKAHYEKVSLAMKNK